MHRSWTKLTALAPSARELEARAEALAQAQAQALQIETTSESLVPSDEPLADAAEDASRDRLPVG